MGLIEKLFGAHENGNAQEITIESRDRKFWFRLILVKKSNSLDETDPIVKLIHKKLIRNAFIQRTDGHFFNVAPGS